MHRSQAQAEGYGDRRVSRAVKRDKGWQRDPVFRGVIVVDDRDPARARLWRPMLYAGEEALLGGPDAARALGWEGTPALSARADPEIWLPTGTSLDDRPGARFRQARSLSAHGSRIAGVPPLLSVPRLLLSLATDVSLVRLQAMVDSALAHKDTTLAEIGKVLGPSWRGCEGAAGLADALRTWEPTFEAIAERRFAWLMERAGVPLQPQPQLTFPDGTPLTPDFGVKGTMRFFEIDSQAHHSSRWQRKRDQKRDRAIREMPGGDVLRIECTDVMRRPAAVVAEAVAWARPGTPRTEWWSRTEVS